MMSILIIFNHLDMKDELQDVGINLGIPLSSLEAIFSSSKPSNLCFLDVLVWWQKNSATPSYKSLAQALHDSGMHDVEKRVLDEKCTFGFRENECKFTNLFNSLIGVKCHYKALVLVLVLC